MKLYLQLLSHKEVLDNVVQWTPSIKEEIESVFELHQALKRTSKEQVDQWLAEGKPARHCSTERVAQGAIRRE